jgi:hypothetical protein
MRKPMVVAQRVQGVLICFMPLSPCLMLRYANIQILPTYVDGIVREFLTSKSATALGSMSILPILDA